VSRPVSIALSSLTVAGLVAGGFWASRPDSSADSTAARHILTPPASAPATAPPPVTAAPSGTPTPTPTATAATGQQLLATALDLMRRANTGSVTWTTERKSSSTVQEVEFDGEYDLAADRWAGRAIVDVRRKGDAKQDLRFRYVGTADALYAALDRSEEGERRWIPVASGAGPVAGDGTALLDTLAATTVTEVRPGERLTLIGDLPARFATRLLGLDVALRKDGVQPDQLAGSARIEIGLTRDGAPRTVSVLGSTLQSANLPEPWRKEAARMSFDGRVRELGKPKSIPPLPRASTVATQGDSTGGPRSA
jgi:hypothetical protein